MTVSRVVVIYEVLMVFYHEVKAKKENKWNYANKN